MQFQVTMPKLSPTMTEGTIAKWHKKEGDFVEANEVLLEITTDKATLEHSALDSGWLRKIVSLEGTTVTVNEPIALFTETKDEPFQELPPKKEVKAEPKSQATISDEKTAAPEKVVAARQEPLFIPEPPLEKISFDTKEEVKASPLARFMAKAKGLDLKTARGSGPGGRITSKDLSTASSKSLVSFGKKETPTNLAGSYEEIPLTPMRKTIARRLQESKSYIPHFYVKQTIDAEPLEMIREQLKNLNLKVTFNDLIVRAAALALKEHPVINSGFNSQTQSIVQFKTIDISIAVTLKEGLITPIIRHADFKNVGEISTEIKLLADKAKAGKLEPQEYKGGSFTISNLGMFGISEFAAIINPPQAAILAIGGIEEKPVIKEGKVVPGKTLSLVLAVDHRVIDGVEAAKFLKTVQKLLENPASLIV